MTKAAEPKRIAIFLPSLAGGGAERVALASAADLLARGHRVDLVLARKQGELLAVVPEGARVIDLGAKRIAAAVGPLARYLKRERPDALHAVMWPITVVGIVAHALARSKARLMVSDQVALSQQVTGGRQLALLKLTTRLLYPRADIRVACSGGAADDLARLSRIPRDRIEVIFNPITPPKVIATNAEVEALWGDATDRIITTGSLKEQKNHALLLQAFAMLDRPGAKLMILGEGHLRAMLEEKARALGIADRVLMPGFALDPWPFLASAELFVLSSDYEGFGNVLPEAMCAGLRVVSTDCPSGPSEILEGGAFGRLVRPGDAEALAQAIAAELDCPAMPERQRARALALSGPQTIARYTELLTA